MEIRTIIGRKLNYMNGILRRQVELDRPLKNRKDVRLTYIYYSPPKNPLDFISKRFFLYPYYCRKRDLIEKNSINHITFQYLGDLGHFLDKSRTIITCHDIFTFLERNNIKNPYFFQKYASLGLKKCRYIISISNFTKSELIKKLKVPSSKIIVIKNGMNRKMFYHIEEVNKSEILPLYPEFKKILHVGSEINRKDFLTLLKAFYLMKKKMKNLKLIRVGSPSYMKLIKSLGLEKDIIYLTNISNKRLREIYNLSDVLVYPSLYEGWGAPGLEAASCGTPVICTDIPVFREVYQDFPLFFPPRNYKALADKVINCIKNDDLKREMSKKGLIIVKKHSWRKSAEKYFKFMKYVYDN